MACVSEAIGLALPGSAGTPAPYEARDKWAEESGEAVMELLAARHPPARHRHPQEPRERRPRRRGLGRLDQRRPAPAGDRARVRASSSTCTTWPRSSATTPYIADLKPAGRYVMKDLGEVGGVPLLMKALLDGGYLHGDCITVTGRTIAENLAETSLRPATRTWSGRPRSPITSWGGVVGLQGHAGAGGCDRQGGRPARASSSAARRACFDCEEDAMAAVQARHYQRGRGAGDPLRGPEGRPRHARDAGRDLGASTARAWATRWR